MSGAPRVVFDTNVLVSAAVSVSGTPAQLVRGWLDFSELIGITSEALLAELGGVVQRPHLRSRVSAGGVEPGDFVANIRSAALLVEPTFRLDVVPRDPADNRVVEAAVAGNADYIVSGDSDLVSLGYAAGIRVVTPVEMLAILAAR